MSTDDTRAQRSHARSGVTALNVVKRECVKALMGNWLKVRTKVSVKSLLPLVRDKPSKDCLDKRQKAFWPRSILQMHGRRLACLNDFPSYLQVGFLSEPSPDEDMIDGSLRKPGPHIFHTFPEKHLQIGASELSVIPSRRIFWLMFLLLFVSWCVLSAPTTSQSEAILTHRGLVLGVSEAV